MSSLIKNCNNNSRRVFHLLSSKKTYKITNWAVILLIFCLMTAIHGSTCPSSSSTSDVIASEQCSFSGYADSQTYNVALGPVSASLYYLYYINTPGNSWGIRKTNPDGTLAWMAALSFRPIVKGLSIDTLEQYVYVGSYTNPLNVIRLGAGTGSIVDAQR